jgi:ureidoacrylate peracid hydrolase
MSEATTTAVIVIDMQNDTVHPEGAFASTGAADHAASQHVIPNVLNILEAARASSTPVFFHRIVVYPGDVGGSNAPIFRMLGPDSFKLGTWGAQIVDELTPVEGEIVLDRNRMSIFNGTGIDYMLRNLAVTDLIIVGAWSNMAVEHSVRDAADHGYGVTIVSDATSSLSPQWQHAALNFALQNIATVADADSVITALRS